MNLEYLAGQVAGASLVSAIISLGVSIGIDRTQSGRSAPQRTAFMILAAIGVSAALGYRPEAWWHGIFGLPGALVGVLVAVLIRPKRAKGSDTKEPL